MCLVFEAGRRTVLANRGAELGELLGTRRPACDKRVGGGDHRKHVVNSSRAAGELFGS